MIKKRAGLKTVPASSAEQTRTALVRAALKLFGRHGFDGTSTRAIAAEAGANIASIAYHFGGKEGLRLACADLIVATMGDLASRALAREAPLPTDPDQARAALLAAVDRMGGFIVAGPEAGEIVQFVLRELSTPTEAMDRIYAGVFEPVHSRICALWEAATGEPAESEDTKLAVFTMIGQVVYFRIAREAVRRRMGWPDISPEHALRIAAVARQNLAAVLDSRQGKKP